MRSKAEDLLTVRERILPHRDRLRQQYRVARLAIFGSYARGDTRRHSDVDILVDFEPGGATFDNYMDLKFYLERLLHSRVDLVTIDALHPELKSIILSEAVDV